MESKDQVRSRRNCPDCGEGLIEREVTSGLGQFGEPVIIDKRKVCASCKRYINDDGTTELILDVQHNVETDLDDVAGVMRDQAAFDEDLLTT